MSWFPRPSTPRAAFRDLLAFMRQRSREQVIAGALAFLCTAIIVIEFIVDPKIGTAPPPRVVEVELYPANRTDADIIADQKKDMAAREAAAKERQRQFQKLGKQFGVE
ncbi:MAG TPA: hypothetical protein VFR92_00720 [Sphingomicrobium sp.]|jgi:hypothetical protein|nr:hypothetical protein [Sphingomicrobium sp.]